MSVDDCGLIGTPTRDGWDYTRVCYRHQWASLPCTNRVDALTSACPTCEAAMDAADGETRYQQLMDRRSVDETVARAVRD